MLLYEYASSNGQPVSRNADTHDLWHAVETWEYCPSLAAIAMTTPAEESPTPDQLRIICDEWRNNDQCRAAVEKTADHFPVVTPKKEVWDVDRSFKSYLEEQCGELFWRA